MRQADICELLHGFDADCRRQIGAPLADPPICAVVYSRMDQDPEQAIYKKFGYRSGPLNFS
jgi:hypothetical protein